MSTERLQTLSIFGKEFPIRTSEAPDRVEAVAAHVDACMREVAGTLAVKDPVRVAILASLNIAGDMRASREAHDDIEFRLRRLVNRVDRALNPDSGLPEA
ncbi:MAG: cell division protein ZapA [Calditrichaeota bacterium]|nr:cell division protein ZapA [Calditrichota bacterium]